MASLKRAIAWSVFSYVSSFLKCHCKLFLSLIFIYQMCNLMIICYRCKLQSFPELKMSFHVFSGLIHSWKTMRYPWLYQKTSLRPWVKVCASKQLLSISWCTVTCHFAVTSLVFELLLSWKAFFLLKPRFQNIRRIHFGFYSNTQHIWWEFLMVSAKEIAFNKQVILYWSVCKCD